MELEPLKAKRNAPAYAEASVSITAPREIVWSLMADVGEWPSWNPKITRATLDGELSRGARIVWKSGPGTIRSTVADVQPGERLSWTGSFMGIRAIHVWTLAADGNETIVTTQESWEGLVARLAKRSSRRTLDDALTSGLQYLKTAAEKAAEQAAALQHV